jgi:hypothetical protein
MEHLLQRISIVNVFHWEHNNYFFRLTNTLYRNDPESVHAINNGSFYLRIHHLKLLGFGQVFTRSKLNYFLFINFNL